MPVIIRRRSDHIVLPLLLLLGAIIGFAIINAVATASGATGGAGQTIGNTIVFIAGVVGIIWLPIGILRFFTDKKRGDKTSLNGIEGWLAYFVLGLYITAAILVFVLFTRLTQYDTYDTAGITWLWNYDVVSSFIEAVLTIVAIVMIHKRHPRTPQFIMVYLALMAIAGVTDYSLGQQALGSNFTGSGYDQGGRTTVWGLAWLWYFGVSKRVKATFGNNHVAAHSHSTIAVNIEAKIPASLLEEGLKELLTTHNNVRSAIHTHDEQEKEFMISRISEMSQNRLVPGLDSREAHGARIYDYQEFSDPKTGRNYDVYFDVTSWAE